MIIEKAEVSRALNYRMVTLILLTVRQIIFALLRHCSGILCITFTWFSEQFALLLVFVFFNSAIEWQWAPLCLDYIVAAVDIVMVDRVAKGSHRGRGQAPSEATSHYAAESPDIVLLMLCLLTIITNLGYDMIVFIPVEHMVHLQELIVEVRPVPLDIGYEHSILKLIQFFILPKEGKVCEINYIEVGCPERIISFHAFVPDVDNESEVAGVIVSFEDFRVGVVENFHLWGATSDVVFVDE